MIRLGLASAVLAVALLSAGTPAQARIYKWVDNGGITHYSQEPPPNGEVQVINPRAAPPSPAPQAGSGDGGSGSAGSGAADTSGDAGADQGDSGQNESMADYCKRLRDQSQMLASDRRVRLKQADGTLQPLVGDARKKQQAQISSQIAQYCSD